MLSEESRISLPDAPRSEAENPVAAWQQDVVIDTYAPLDPSRYPLYLDRRVYQGSSGRVYPMPFHERIDAHKVPRAWQAVHLENAWVRLMILPELGGRIHVGLDKTRGYDFFYRNNVIKPALVGLAGPWLSGGVEFNWPQHHRPATFLPVDVTIERDPDGSVTVWCADLDPFARLKGMHGIRLRPDSAVVELRGRLYNRTDDVQTFLWWANVAAPVNDRYQSFFPEDVHHVADHAKRAIVEFPRARGRYYGVDYQGRVDGAHPDADRIDWYRNIPVPTSYMCVDSQGDFFGGYDHGARAGLVHWADHRVSPGKKQWTWGNGPFGWAWDRNLTDGDGPYIELMAGVFTDNQPDFTFLAPGETKTFTQCWYPIQDIGPAHIATTDVAVHLEAQAGSARVSLGVAATARRANLRVSLLDDRGTSVWGVQDDVAPGAPMVADVVLPDGADVQALTLVVDHEGTELLRWRRGDEPEGARPEPATEPPAPADIATVEELYLTGVHLEQYRHATRAPEPYWEEALRRDPGDSRVCVALAARRYRAGRLLEAEQLLRTAISRLTSRNPNPQDGEAFYRLGLALRDLGRPDEAYDALAKATWSAPWRAPGWTAMARLDLAAGRPARALETVDLVLTVEAEHLQALALRALALRMLGRHGDAVLASARRIDPLDWFTRDLAGECLDVDAQVLVDVALEYASCGRTDDALRLFDAATKQETDRPVLGQVRVGPMAGYHKARVLDAAGRSTEADDAMRDARAADDTWCFPGRLADALTLRWVTERAPQDTRAWALLGHWLYAQGRHEDAVNAWRRGDPDDVVVARNLGMAAWNVLGSPTEAVRWYEHAMEVAPTDARLLSERDQLARRCGEDARTRLARLEERLELVVQRDDLCAQRAMLQVLVGAPADAVELLSERQFQPWEGGEGVVLAAWDLAHLALAHEHLAAGDGWAAECDVRSALEPPSNLGEGRHLLANRADLLLVLGDALALQGDREGARRLWADAGAVEGDFLEMAPTDISEKSVYSALAWRRLGEEAKAEALLSRMEAAAAIAEADEGRIDYFATSLPALLLFTDDLAASRRVTASILRAQVAVLRGVGAGIERLLLPVVQVDPCNVHAHLLRTTLAQAAVDLRG
jgi:tetratricopeptide (TPR) repeat protein